MKITLYQIDFKVFKLTMIKKWKFSFYRCGSLLKQILFEKKSL